MSLIKHGAQVTEEDNGGATPLHYAAYSNRLEAAEILLKNGALINARAKAWEYEKEGRWLEALVAYRKSGSDYSHLSEGLILLNIGRITEAKESLQEDPLYQWIYLKLSEIYTHLGESDNACNILKEAVKINPVSDYEYQLASYFLKGKKTRGKEEIFRQVPGFGEDSHTHSLINQICYERRDYHEYLRNSLIAWWLDKDSFYATSYVAVAWHNLQEFSCAAFWYRKTLKIAPISHETYYRMAYLEAQRGNMKAAKRCLEKAETLAPRDPEARYWRKLINKAKRRKPDGPVSKSAGNSGGLLFRA